MSAPSPFFEQRGISTAVHKARPYIAYSKGDSALVREHWSNSRSFAARIANQSKGLVIPRYAPKSLGLPLVPAELRPDTAVVTSSHWHFHGDDPENAELVFPRSGKPLTKGWIHAPEAMQRHIEKKHGGVNTQTVHLDENEAKYVFPPGNGAKRLDVHPHAWTRFPGAARVFFGIEGCLKADAILSAGEAVFSVPSVTLWNAPELAAFSTYLRGRVVYIIPDADWYKNGAVLTQAMFCRTFLRRLGIDAHVAAPPLESGEKGVDDYLGSGGTVEDMSVLARETPYGLAEFLAERRTWRKDKVVLGAEILEGFQLHADSKGQIRASLRSVARIMGVHHSRVERGLKALQECGAVEIEGSLKTYARHYDRNKGWVGWEWEDRPAITVAPELRAKDSTHRLGG